MATVPFPDKADTVSLGEIILLLAICIVFPSFYQDLERSRSLVVVSFLIRVEVPVEDTPAAVSANKLSVEVIFRNQ